MKQLIFIISIFMMSCCSGKKTTAGNPATTDSSVVTKKENPACINKLIAAFEAEEMQNPPRKIYRYTYKGKTVYYVPAICCDFYSDLYDTDCNLIGHPDGGFTGRGDGVTTDFDSIKSNEKLIWADKRGQ